MTKITSTGNDLGASPVCPVDIWPRFFSDRHVMLPKNVAKLVPKDKLMSEHEWRGIGVQQSQGWIHYMRHKPGNGSDVCSLSFCGQRGESVPEPHILLFRRPRSDRVQTKGWTDLANHERIQQVIVQVDSTDIDVLTCVLLLLCVVLLGTCSFRRCDN